MVLSFYGVAKGRITGVFTTWEECEAQVEDFDGAWFQKFDTKEEAEIFVKGSSSLGTGEVCKPSIKVTTASSVALKMRIINIPNVTSAKKAEPPVVKDSVPAPGGSKQGKHTTCYYVVAKGRIPGTYWNWPDAYQQLKEFKGNVYKKFDNLKDAELYYVDHCE